MRDRYPVDDWNIYAAQASDGDNWADDSPNCRQIMQQQLLPLVRYYAYIEITNRQHQSLWRVYKLLAEEHPHFAIKHIRSVEDIYPVFRELFKQNRTVTTGGQ